MDVLPLYFSEHVIKHYEIDAAGRFSLAALANHVQENAAEHARRLKVGFKDLQVNNHAWMLSRIRFTYLSSPRLGDHFETETWVKDYDRLFSYRDFHFKRNDEIFAVANSAWVIADPVNRKIVPVEQYVNKAYKLKDRCAVNEPLPKLKGVEGKAEHVFIHQVHFSSIDLNHHANNISYLQWYLDYLPDNLALVPVANITVNYLHEVKLDDKISIYYDIRKDGDAFHINCEMVNGATEQVACRLQAVHKK